MAKRKPTAPLLGDENAYAVAKKAAAAVGLDVESLANLMVDGGVTALPPSDGITGRYTLEDLGMRLWSQVQEQPKTERIQWYQKLLEPQQVAVIVVLRDRGYATTIIAQEFGIAPLEVTRVWNRYGAEMGAQVLGLRLDTIAGQLQVVKERVQQVAWEKQDGRTVWKVEMDFLKALQSLGIVDSAIHKVEHTHKFDDQQRAEVDAFLELEEKKRKRGEEIKQIEATVVAGDPLPEMEDYDDE